MRVLLCCFTVISCSISVGCGGGGQVTPKEPTLVNYLNDFEVALIDATGTVQSVQTSAETPKQQSDGAAEQDEDPPEVQIRGVIQMLKSSADQLAQSASSHSAEADVKSIQTDAEALLRKAQGVPNASEILQGLQQLSAKAEALKSKL